MKKMLLTGIVAEYGVGCCWSYCRLIGPLGSSTADPLGGVLEVGLKQYVVHICGMYYYYWSSNEPTYVTTFL